MKSFIPVLLCLVTSVLGGEVEEAKRLAPKYKAEVEVRLWDGTRCDLVNDTYAIEVDWSKKYAEAVGQAVYYATVLNKKPAILLLVKNKKAESRYLHRAQTLCAKLGIRMFIEQAIGIKRTDKPVYGYMLYDTGDKVWYAPGPLLSVTTWQVNQQRGHIWLSSGQAESVKRSIFGPRRPRLTVRKFLLLEVSN